jgi:hypothetical protein
MSAAWHVEWDFPIHVAPYGSNEKGVLEGFSVVEIDVDRNTLIKISGVSRRHWQRAREANENFYQTFRRTGHVDYDYFQIPCFDVLFWLDLGRYNRELEALVWRLRERPEDEARV